MTYRELMDEVAALGFDSAVEDTGVLVAATNRAQRQLDRALGGAGVYVTLCMSAPAFSSEATREVAGEWRLPAAGAIALSFESVGQGTLTLALGGEVRQYALTGSSYRERRYLFPEMRGATVTLRGTAGLCVRALTVFGTVGDCPGADALPLVREGMWEYNLTALCPTCVGLRALPVDARGLPVRDFELRDGVLLLPDGKRDVTLCLARRRHTVVRDDFETSMGLSRLLDIPPEREDLLPLAVAAYTLLDVEPEKAERYKKELEAQLGEARRHGGVARVPVYDVRGWR